MKRYEEMVEIQVLYKQGNGVRQIAKMLQISRNTVRRYLSQSVKEPGYSRRKAVRSKLDEYKPYLIKRRKLALPGVIPATVLFKELQEEGYGGSVSLLRQYLRSISELREVPVVRFETDPGKQMQVDWAI